MEGGRLVYFVQPAFIKEIFMKKPVVSVIMPVRNGEKFVAEAIDSILNQTYQDFEMFIINDDSTDGTKAIIEAYQNRFPDKIKLINLKNRHGAFGSANLAMKKISGEFIAPMDSDDVSHPERFEKEVGLLLSNPEVIVVGSWARVIDSKSRVIGEKVFETDHNEIYASFFNVHPIVHPSCMIRRSMLPQKNRLYQDKFGVNDDYFTLFTLLGLGKFANIPEYLLNYRVHLENSSLQRLKSKFFNTVKIRFTIIRHFGYKPSLASILEFIMQMLVITLIPEVVFQKLYFYVKGINTSKNPTRIIKIRANPVYLKLKHYLFLFF